MIAALAPAPSGADRHAFHLLPAPRALVPDDRLFPERLRTIANRPSVLWIRTSITDAALVDLQSRRSVAIVGSRAAGHAGMSVSRGLAWELARAGVVIVSGLARGIDAAAHEGALLAGGATVAVLGSGLDACYPPEHESLAADIAKHGALMSEWPACTPPAGWRFPRRNRLLSGLADVTVLVEGTATSGALHTVRYALEQGREVMAVPRDPLSVGAEAPNRLLREGASPATCAVDVLGLLAALPGRAQPLHERVGAACGIGDGCDDAARPFVRLDAAVQVTRSVQLDALTEEIAPAHAPMAEEARGHADPQSDRSVRTSQMPAIAQERSANPDESLRGRLLAHVSRDGALSFETLIARLPDAAVASVMAQLVTLEIEGRVSRDARGRFRVSP